MRIRIDGTDLPGSSCGPGPEFPDGHFNVHVAVQGRKGKHDLYGLVSADVDRVRWDFNCDVLSPPPAADLRGPQIQGLPGRRFVYLTWGVVDDAGAFTMFRRAKLWLDAVPEDVMQSACATGLLVGELRLSDEQGWPLCAAVRPPRIRWRAPRTGSTA